MNKHFLHKKAQSIVEFCLVFVIASILMLFILECAFYYRTFFSLQTFTDEIGANLSSIGRFEVCKALPDTDILPMIEGRAKKYLENDLNLRYTNTSDDSLKIESASTYLGKKRLVIFISCALAPEIRVKSEYLYEGMFLFKLGQVMTSISSVQGPRF